MQFVSAQHGVTRFTGDSYRFPLNKVWRQWGSRLPHVLLVFQFWFSLLRGSLNRRLLLRLVGRFLLSNPSTGPAHTEGRSAATFPTCLGSFLLFVFLICLMLCLRFRQVSEIANIPALQASFLKKVIVLFGVIADLPSLVFSFVFILLHFIPPPFVVSFL